MRRKALLCAYSVRASEEKIGVVSELNIEQPKTKVVSNLLNKIGVFGDGKTYNGRTLLVISSNNRNVYLSGRNIKNVDVKSVNDVNAYDVIRASNIIFVDKNIIGKIEEAVA
jgi:large subunit ribosomal protein L4